MMSTYKCVVCIFGRYSQNNLPLALSSVNYPHLNDTFQQTRGIKKHYNQKFRKERARKVVKPELIDYYAKDYNFKDYMNTKMKSLGILPRKETKEKPILISSTPDIFESFVVPKGDGMFSDVSNKFKFPIDILKKKSKNHMAIKKIKSYDENFAPKTFGEQGLEIYKKAHEALVAKDQDALLQYVTERAYPMMTHNLWDKTIVWKFLESLEPAIVAHARCTNLHTKTNEFAQVTVRFHTQQILCIYDRFGRLMLGSETVKKDVLDYVVFENHLSNNYGTWRIHGKIIPDWMEPKEVSVKTYMSTPEEDLSPELSEKMSV